MVKPQPCQPCKGTGKKYPRRVSSPVCPHCHGTKRATDNR